MRCASSLCAKNSNTRCDVLIQKLEMARAEVSKSWQAANAKVEGLGKAFVSKLVSAGASEAQADKVRRKNLRKTWSS